MGNRKDFATFIERGKGTDEWPELTVELQAPYNPEFQEALKQGIPRGARTWDDVNKVWRVLPSYSQQAKQIAMEHFPAVWVEDGSVSKELKSGRVVEQKGLF